MDDSNKKRSNSFRKILPSIFFSNKSKNKNQKQSHLKNVPDESSKNNPNARPTGRPEKQINAIEYKPERIYENVIARHTQKHEITYRDVSSNHSSSSTLVSESAKHQTNPSSWQYAINQNEQYHAATPQVPPKPINEVVHAQLNNNVSTESHYPDVYYHSLEHLTNKVSPVEEIEIYKASQDHANPTSVGAEIKRVSTKFLISPKKEAEVRTIQPKRARSLSFNNELPELSKSSEISTKNELTVNKPYNYSAPTSPIPVSHKIPNMPKTVSPYEHVRKVMTETEAKRNSLNRSSNRNTFTPSPRNEANPVIRSQKRTSSPIKEYKLAEDEREKTRQKVEVFYWQKLKELKEKEEEYLLSVNPYVSSPDRYNSTRTHSSCSTPNSLVGEHKSYSLPRGKSLNTYAVKQTVQSNSPFERGAPERRTDTYVNQVNRGFYSGDPGIVYRHPEKLLLRSKSPDPITNMQEHAIFREPQRRDNQSVSQQTKRVSFEEQYPVKTSRHTIDVLNRDKIKSVGANVRTPYYDIFKDDNGSKKIPPQPPIRSSSTRRNVAIMTQKKSVNSIGGSRSIYSESESGSEAGEIQRILQSNARKGE